MVELRESLSNEQEKVKIKMAELEQLSKQKQELEENLNMEIKEMNKAQVGLNGGISHIRRPQTIFIIEICF